MPTIPYILPAKPVKPKPKNRRKRKPYRDRTPQQKQAKGARKRANRRRALEATKQAGRIVRMSMADSSSFIFPPHAQSDTDVAKGQLALSRGGISRYQQMVIAKDLYEALSQGRESEELKAAARFLGLKPNPSLQDAEALLRDLLPRGEGERPQQQRLRRRAFRGPRRKKVVDGMGSPV